MTVTSFDSYVYSKSAATRILGTEVVNTVPDDHSLIIWCWLPKGQKAVSIPKAKFKEHFAERRRTLGNQITDVKAVNSYTYRVNQKYLVAVFPDRVSCTCGDYATQQELGIQRGCCKHGYAVLKTLGCTSLAEFIEKQKDVPQATNQKSTSSAPDLFPIKKKSANDYSIVYELVFETYASEEQDGYEVPMDTVERYMERKPSAKEINCFRKHAHERGYKLVAVNEQKRYAHDEF